MDFDFTENEKEFQQRIKGLFDSESLASLGRLEKSSTDEVRDALLGVSAKLAEIGYLEIGLENERASVRLVAVQEVLAALSPALFLSIETSTRIFGRLLSIHGTAELKAEILPSLRTGSTIGAVALSEECTSIENNPFETQGRLLGGGYQVTGAKGQVLNAPVSDWIAIAGETEAGIAFFVISKDNEGVFIGERLSTLGYGGTASSAVKLENCPVGAGRVIGPFEERAPLAALRAWEDQVLTAASLGVMQRCFETASKHAKNHVSGDKPIIAYQEVGFKLAEMLTLLQTSRLLAYRAAWMSETGDGEAQILTRCAKVFCSESAEEVASNAIQVMGGKGYLSGNPAEEGFRDAKYLQIAGTSSEISRMKIADGVSEAGF